MTLSPSVNCFKLRLLFKMVYSVSILLCLHVMNNFFWFFSPWLTIECVLISFCSCQKQERSSTFHVDSSKPTERELLSRQYST